MVRCIVPNCQSGYDSQQGKEKIHFFKVPKDSIDEYQRAIKRKCFVVNSTHFVCHKHYLSEDILWKREVKDAAGNALASVCTYINNNVNIICGLQLSRKCKRIKFIIFKL